MSTRRTRHRLVLLVTFLIFLIPVITAWTLNILAPDWRPFGTVNHGRLVQPVRALVSTALRGVDGTPIPEHYLSGRWTLVHLQPGDCGPECREALMRTRQVRRALGEDTPRVQRLVVRGPGSPRDTSVPGSDHPDLLVAEVGDEWLANFSFTDAPSRALGGIFLVDPQGYLMMRYPLDVAMRDLHDDLKRLLRISKIG
jgi:cytochrome oxidase Cu insertion factor (SCO1/SenC/PrrC family)